jgi:hypothetical protein
MIFGTKIYHLAILLPRRAKTTNGKFLFFSDRNEEKKAKKSNSSKRAANSFLDETD